MAEAGKKKYIEVRKGGDYEAIGQKYGIHPLVARVIRNREIASEAELEKYLYGKMDDLYDPHLLKDADKAAGIIKDEIDKKSKIRIIGDYDIDGVMSSYILKRGLDRAGADASVQIPHRISDGYGLNRNLIEEAKSDGVDCIITCDNGISALEEIALAKEYGMRVVVTDHHQVTAGIPVADAVVNPHQKDCTYPFKEICGATVAWKVVLVLFERLGIPKEEGFALIENVAFATVGDIMPLTDENRVIVKAGLRAIKHTQNLGMRALIEQCGLKEKEIKSYHFGFVLGPCINATGRLDTASRALELFLTEDARKASKIAEELFVLNESRKELTLEGVEQAVKVYEEGDYASEPVTVLYLPEVHESIAGIIAGRIRERYYKPTFVLTKGEECVKGSARSIEGYSLSEEMKKHSDVFLKYGGHPKAAGLSIEEARIEEFRRRMNDDCPLTLEDEIETIYLDACPPLSSLTIEMVEQLNVLEPIGNENRGPMFGASKLSVLRMWRIGKNQNYVKLQVSDGSGVYNAVCFSDADVLFDFYTQKFGADEVEKATKGKANNIICSLIYVPKINDFNGPEISLEIKHYM